MKAIWSAAIAAITTLLLAVSPVSAAKWSCTGPDFVCGSASKPVTASKKAYKASNKSKKKSTYAARKTSPSTSYSGGGSRGMASYYWQGTRTASGARFNPNGLTAAHRSLPFGTRVRVTNLRNGRSVTVTINDRGPFIKGRVIDLSRGAASVIGMTASGVAPVAYSVVGRG